MKIKGLVIVFTVALCALVFSTGNANAKSLHDDSMKGTTILAGNQKTKGKNQKNAPESGKTSVNDACVKQTFDVYSIVQLIATPEKFHGKCVMVVGFAVFEYEGNAIFLHEDDYKYGMSKNGLWLSISDNQYREKIKEVNRKHVLVQGTFNAFSHGHWDLFSGAIEHIKRLDPKRKRNSD